MAFVDRRRQHDDQVKRTTEGIKKVLETFEDLQQRDAMIDQEREPLNLSTLILNPAVETTYRARKEQERELEHWLRSVHDREEEFQNLVDEDISRIQMETETKLGDDIQRIDRSKEHFDFVLDQIKQAVYYLQVFGRRLLDHSRSVAQRELSLDDFNVKLQNEMLQLSHVLRDGSPDSVRRKLVRDRRVNILPLSKEEGGEEGGLEGEGGETGEGEAVTPTHSPRRDLAQATEPMQRRLIKELEGTIDSQRAIIESMETQIKHRDIDIEELTEELQEKEVLLEKIGGRKLLIPKYTRGTTVAGLHDTTNAGTMTEEGTFRRSSTLSVGRPSFVQQDPDLVVQHAIGEVNPTSWRTSLFQFHREAQQAHAEASKLFGLWKTKTDAPLFWNQYAVVQLLNAYSKQYKQLHLRHKHTQFSFQCLRKAYVQMKARVELAKEGAIMTLERTNAQEISKRDLMLARSVEESKAMANTIRLLASKLKNQEREVQRAMDQEYQAYMLQEGGEGSVRTEASGEGQGEGEAATSAASKPRMDPPSKYVEAIGALTQCVKRAQQASLQKVLKSATDAQRVTELHCSSPELTEKWKAFDTNRGALNDLLEEVEKAASRVARLHHPLTLDIAAELEDILARSEESLSTLNAKLTRPQRSATPSALRLRTPRGATPLSLTVSSEAPLLAGTMTRSPLSGTLESLTIGLPGALSNVSFGSRSTATEGEVGEGTLRALSADQRSFLDETTTNLLNTFSGMPGFDDIADVIQGAVFEANEGITTLGTDLEGTVRQVAASAQQPSSGETPSSETPTSLWSERPGTATSTEGSPHRPARKRRTKDCGIQCELAPAVRSTGRVSPARAATSSTTSAAAASKDDRYDAGGKAVERSRIALTRVPVPTVSPPRKERPLHPPDDPRYLQEMIARQEKKLEAMHRLHDDIVHSRAKDLEAEFARIALIGIDEVPHQFPVYPEMPQSVATIQERPHVKDHPSLRPPPVNYGRPPLKRPQSARTVSTFSDSSLLPSRDKQRPQSRASPRPGSRQQPFHVPTPPPPPSGM